MPDSINFKKQEKATLGAASEIAMRPGDVVLDWYPRVAAKASKGVTQTQIVTTRRTATLGEAQLAFMNFDAIYLDLQRLKAERGWHNLNLGRDTPRSLC